MARPKVTHKAGPASRELLGSIHLALAERLLENVRQPEVTAAMLSVARSFLADQGINAETLNKGAIADAVESVAGARVPFGDDSNVYFLPAQPKASPQGPRREHPEDDAVRLTPFAEPSGEEPSGDASRDQ